MPCLGLLSHLLSCPTLPCRHVYTTPKSFLSMTQLYKGLLAGKRATVTASIQRLEAGLAKLRKTQGDVDVLVEQARAIAVEVRLGGSWSAGGWSRLRAGQGTYHWNWWHVQRIISMLQITWRCLLAISLCAG